MCRNIRTLHNFEPPANEEEVHDAALQYVRKISGSTKPSQANEEAFDRAVAEVTAATQRLLDGLVTNAPGEGPRGRGGQAQGQGPGAVRQRLSHDDESPPGVTEAGARALPRRPEFEGPQPGSPAGL